MVGGQPLDLFAFKQGANTRCTRHHTGDYYADGPVGVALNTVNLTIPEGTRNGKVFRLAKLGMPKLRRPDERGDLYVTVAIELPRKLGDEEKELVRQWRELRDK